MKKINYLGIIDFFKPILYYLALVMVPLGMSFFLPIYSPFTMIKSAWLGILGSLSVLLYLASFWLNFRAGKKKINIKFIITLIPWGLFLVTLLILNIFSINPTQSFFGSYNRQSGILFYGMLALWFGMIVYYFSGLAKNYGDTFFRFQKLVKRTSLAIALSSTLVSVYACLQFVGYDFNLWQEGQLLSRSISTLGQPNYLGSFLLFGLSMTAYLLYLNKKFFVRSLICISLVVQLLALVSSGSRSAWLAFIFSSVLVALVMLWPKWRGKTIIFLAGILFCIFSFFTVTSPARLQALLSWNEGSLGLRAYFYQAAPKLIGQNILIGTGLENGGEAIITSYEPDWGIFMAINGYSDKLHNSLLDALLQLGIFGFSFYILLYLFVARQFIILWRRAETKVFATFAGAALIAYSFSLLFGLSDIANIFYFWVLAALGVSANLIFDLRNNRTSKTESHLKEINRIFNFQYIGRVKKIFLLVASFLLTCFAISQIYLNLSSVRADHYFLNLYQQSLNKEYFTADLLYQYILEDVHQPVYRTYYQRAYAFLILDNLSSDLDRSTIKMSKNSAENILNDLASNDYENIYTKANLDCRLNGPNRAMNKFDDLQRISSRRPAIYVARGDCLAETNSELALENYHQALSLLPDTNDFRLTGEHINYLNYYNYFIFRKIANLYYNNESYEKAQEAYKQASFFYPNDLKLLEDISKTAFYLQDYQQSYQNLEHAYLRNSDLYWLERLMALAYNLNDGAKLDKYVNTWQKLSGQEAKDIMNNLIFP